MIGNVAKWGNSLAIRIPQHLAKEIGLIDGVRVEIAVEEHRLTIVPIQPREYSLDDLVAGITPENIHSQIDTGSPVGEEVS